MNKHITADELRSKYIAFFKSKGHTEISGKSVIPENDPTVLFTTAGMHPLVPYLMGEPHPAGTRLTDYQKCIRTGDIDAVGDASHLTFFEMLGNWSLGDYFKKEAIGFSFEFLTSPQYLNIPVDLPARITGGGPQGKPVRAVPTRKCSSTRESLRAAPHVARVAAAVSTLKYGTMSLCSTAKSKTVPITRWSGTVSIPVWELNVPLQCCKARNPCTKPRFLPR